MGHTGPEHDECIKASEAAFWLLLAFWCERKPSIAGHQPSSSTNRDPQIKFFDINHDYYFLISAHLLFLDWIWESWLELSLLGDERFSMKEPLDWLSHIAEMREICTPRLARLIFKEKNKAFSNDHTIIGYTCSYNWAFQSNKYFWDSSQSDDLKWLRGNCSGW